MAEGGDSSSGRLHPPSASSCARSLRVLWRAVQPHRLALLPPLLTPPSSSYRFFFVIIILLRATIANDFLLLNRQISASRTAGVAQGVELSLKRDFKISASSQVLKKDDKDPVKVNWCMRRTVRCSRPKAKRLAGCLTCGSLLVQYAQVHTLTSLRAKSSMSPQYDFTLHCLHRQKKKKENEIVRTRTALFFRFLRPGSFSCISLLQHRSGTLRHWSSLVELHCGSLCSTPALSSCSARLSFCFSVSFCKYQLDSATRSRRAARGACRRVANERLIGGSNGSYLSQSRCAMQQFELICCDGILAAHAWTRISGTNDKPTHAVVP